jgi:hypothetical protein
MQRGLADDVFYAYVTTMPCFDCAQYMHYSLRNLCAVTAGCTYAQDSRQFFDNNHIRTHVDEAVMQASIDAMIKQGERRR